MCMSSAKSPAPPPPPPPPPEIAKETDPAVAAARKGERSRAALAAGRNSTILTGPMGDLAPALTAKKTVLGN